MKFTKTTAAAARFVVLATAVLCAGPAVRSAGAVEARNFQYQQAPIENGTVIVDAGADWNLWGDLQSAPPGWPDVVEPVSRIAVEDVYNGDALESPRRIVMLYPDATGQQPFAARWISGVLAPFIGLSASTFEATDRPLRRGSEHSEHTVVLFDSFMPATEGKVSGDYETGLSNLYFTRTFEVQNPEQFSTLLIEVEFAGGMIVYLNGEEIARHHILPGWEEFGGWATPFWLPDYVNQTMARRWQITWLGIDAARLKEGNNELSVAVYKRPTGGPRAFYFNLQMRGHQGPGFVRSPYLQSVENRQMTVMWETSFEGIGYVEFGKDPNDLSRVASSARINDTQQEITLTELEPDTRYYYRVHTVPVGYEDSRLQQPFVSQLYSFTTTVEPGTPFTFIAYGDNRSQSEVHTKIIQQMWETALERDARFVISTGDLVEDGSPFFDWQSEFFRPALPLMAFFPYYTSLGNHEGNHESYYHNMSLPGNEAWYNFRSGDAEFFALNSSASFTGDSEQLGWLERALAGSTAIWKIVFFHHPPFACTPSRKPGDLDVQQFIMPILERYGVQLAILGHDHLYGRSVEINGVTYVITGGAGAPTYPAEPDEINRICVREHHYCMVHVTPSSLELRAIALDGVEIDRFTLRP